MVETGMMPQLLLEIALQFFVLSLLSIGGANGVIPEIQRRVVEVHHWMTDEDFAQLFALSQAAPGPNVLIVSLVGWKVAGVLGGVVAMLAMCGPSSLLTTGSRTRGSAGVTRRGGSRSNAVSRRLLPGCSSRRATFCRARPTTFGLHTQ